MIDIRDNDLSLLAPPINITPDAKYLPNMRRWQGIPGIERTRLGRLWAVWYSGGDTEGPDNYVVLITSTDEGASWSTPVVIIDPPGKVRAYDPCLWHDPSGRLWLFWAQSCEWFDGRAGVWAICTSNSEEAHPIWTPPNRITNGVMMNKPVVLSTGEWLLPTAVWGTVAPQRDDMVNEAFSNVTCSSDAGETWTLRGGADVHDRSFDEHMVIERRDGTLWMLVRTKHGIGEAVSTDRGVTWQANQHTVFPGPDARFFIRRLASGRLLLVNHVNFTGRNNLTAMLSDDDGLSWYGHLLLDERNDVSYPDGIQAADGRIFVIYDRERYHAREILLAIFTEEDIRQSCLSSAGSHLRIFVDKAGSVEANGV